MSSRPLVRVLLAAVASGALVATPLAITPAEAATSATATHEHLEAPARSSTRRPP